MLAAAIVDDEPPVLVEEEQLDEAFHGERGWCPTCVAFCVPDVEPGETGRYCASCGDDRAVGTAAAIRGEFIRVQP